MWIWSDLMVKDFAVTREQAKSRRDYLVRSWRIIPHEISTGKSISVEQCVSWVPCGIIEMSSDNNSTHARWSGWWTDVPQSPSISILYSVHARWLTYRFSNSCSQRRDLWVFAVWRETEMCVDLENSIRDSVSIDPHTDSSSRIYWQKWKQRAER